MPDLSDGVNWSQTDANNNRAPPNGWPEGMMPSGVNDAARADRGALKRFWDKINPVQQITPTGGVYTFVTDNIAYPTAYVAGEIYCFRSVGPSAGGEQFQVNALGPKPIWKRIVPGSTGVGPIVAQDIVESVAVQLIYDATLNAGTGVFVLQNPHLPIVGDGAGGVSMPGNIAITGVLTATNGLIVHGAGYFYNGIDVASGNLSVATGNFDAHNITANGVINTVGGITVQGAGLFYNGLTVASGNLSVEPGSLDAYNITANGVINTVGGITVQGAGYFYNGLTVASGNLSVAGGNLDAHNITANGALNVVGDTSINGNLFVYSNGASNGGVSIYATAGAIRSDVGGTAFYAQNGNFVGQNITVAGQGFKPGGGTWAATSDVRLKDDVQDYDVGLAAIIALHPVTYSYNGRGGTGRDGRRFVGLVADEVEDVMPEMVGTISELLDPGDEHPTELKTLDTTALTFALVNCCKELAARIAALETK